MPLIHADPDSIYRTLREWLTTRRGGLRAVGERSRAFASRWHDPVRVAEKVVADYRRVLAERKAAAS
jgi:hypothetical protein